LIGMSETTPARKFETLREKATVTPLFENSYAQLPDRFFARTQSNPVSAPKIIRINRPLASELNLDPDWLESRAGVEMLAGNEFPDGASPIALAYAGHQFGGFVPQLGDGRALLIGEVIDAQGIRRDIQLKGSGPTRFSRHADGRAALGPVLREYIVSEAMAALGIPTTRTLAAVLTGDPVFRETRLPGAILTRVAASHVRIGTFQYFAARGDTDGLKTLSEYVIDRHFPELAKRDQPHLALLEAVISGQAELVARWMLVGFIHGVMNTDNMTISGETIDYGPCAFMDAYDPATVFSSIDSQGRYSYANQPRIAVWNLARLAETLLPLLHEDGDEAVRIAEGALKKFQSIYEASFHRGLRRKLGLLSEQEGDIALIADLFEIMARSQADFTLTFRGLAEEADKPTNEGTTRQLFTDPASFDDWHTRWRERFARESDHGASRQVMLSTNPKYIPRNHRVEAVITAAVEASDFRLFEELLTVVSKPFDEQPDFARYALPPEMHERVLRTFCGT
jgi:uncharacterized protein YdiU (UPF0061 family)